MKFRFWKLFSWHIIIYLAFSIHWNLDSSFDFLKVFGWIFTWKGIVIMSTTALSFFLFSFFAYSIFFYYYEKRPNWQITLMVLVGALMAIGFRFLLQEVIQKAIFGFGNYFKHEPLFYIFDNIYFAIIFSAIGIIFYFIHFSKHKDLLRKKLIVQNQKTELALLRSQINPHFLFNTLNNIYTLVYKKSDNSLTAVERLTTLLRYALYEKEKKVLLQKEIKAINDLVDLQTLRYDYELALDIDIEDGNEQLKIPPFILIPFVENTFKHANLKNPKERAVIKLYSEKEHLIFYAKNEISHQNKDQVGGIGLENIRKRLELIYGEKHELKITENESFEVILKLELQSGVKSEE